MKQALIKMLILIFVGASSLGMASALWAQNVYPVDSFEPVAEEPNEMDLDESLFMIENYEQPLEDAQAIDVAKYQVSSEELASLRNENSDLSKYTLGATDVIEIVVLRHPEFSGQFIINNEGKVQYEYIGDVKVDGMTKNELKDALVELLSQYIISPEITVKIIGYNSKVVYVIGEVSRPGKIFMRGDTITVREALIQSGLPLLTAKASKSAVITPSADGNPKTRKVNVHNLLYKGDLRENLIMKPGDTLFVPPTIMAKTMRAIQPIAQPIGTAAGTGRTIMTGF